MRTTSSRKPGNRRSVDNPASGQAPAMSPSTTSQMFDKAPTISNQPFNNPGRPVIDEMPSIKNVMGTPQPTQSASPAVDTAKEGPVVPATEPTAAPVEETPSMLEPVEEEENFEKCWQQTVENLFHATASTCLMLQRDIPKYENDVITIEVRNQVVGEELERRKRAILEYWRNHFKLNVDDFEVVVNEDMKVGSAILTPEDQFKKMKEQNSQLLGFLNAMNFRMSE